jgi:hypothetical protein
MHIDTDMENMMKFVRMRELLDFFKEKYIGGTFLLPDKK